MSKLWKVGLFVKDYSYFDDVFEFANKLIESKGEEITFIKKTTETFEIETNKSLYEFIIVNESIRGYRWHEAYIFDTWLIDLEKIENLVLAKIVPYDMWNRDVQWNRNKYVHYNPINKSKFITWTRWFESNTYDVIERIFTSHSEYEILEFKGHCVAQKRYIIPSRDIFIELLDYINNVVFKDYIDRSKASPYIKEFIIKNNLKEEYIR